MKLSIFELVLSGFCLFGLSLQVLAFIVAGISLVFILFTSLVIYLLFIIYCFGLSGMFQTLKSYVSSP